MSHLLKFIRSISYCSAVLLTAFAFAACGSDDEPEDGGNGSAADKTDHSVKHKLEQIQYQDTYNGPTQTPFFNITYDSQNRLSSYNALHSRIYYYEYNSDNIQIMRGSTQSSSKALEERYTLKNGRIADNCRYDKDNRLIAIENTPKTFGTCRYDLQWTNGNITKITCTVESSGELIQTYNIHYTDIPCQSLLISMGSNADTGHRLHNPYGLLYHIDPVLVEEGYYGNSIVRNLWDKIESTSKTGDDVTHKITWTNLPDGLPAQAITQWTPGGVAYHHFIWAD